MESNSQPQYKYVIIDNIYHFTTISGVHYIAYFVEIPMFKTSKVYSFSFEKNGNEKSRYDKLVVATIIQIIADFFEKNENTLLFTCDENDGKQHSRNILFHRWYKFYGLNNFDKFDKKINNTFSSIIIQKRNPLYSEIINEFEEFISYLF